MSVSRYRKNRIVTTSNSSYAEILENRGVSSINHFSLEKLKILRMKDVRKISIVNHTWQFSDRYHKLAAEHYNDPTYWWIIAYYNNKPLESDIEVGEVIQIPVPLEFILSALEY